jgi:MFS family permease
MQPEAEAQPEGLWRHRDFLNLWSAETISRFGSEVSNLALPFVAIVVLKASPFEVAALGAVLFLPFLLFALPAGVWVDRLARRPILVASDLVRAITLASVPLAYALDALTMWQLYAVAFIHGIGTVFFDVSYQSYLPSLVRKEQLVDGNSKLELSRAASQIGGPGLGGALVGLLTAPVAVLLDAISFVVSALFLTRIRAHEAPPPREERRAMRVELMEGLRYLWADTRIRAIAASTILFNFFGQICFSIVLVYAVRVLDLGAATIGIVFALGNLGGLAGALMARRISRRIGIGPALALGAASSTMLILVPLAPVSNPIPFLLVALLVMAFGVVLYNVNSISFQQEITPERMLGRLNASRRFLVWGVIPLGALVGGALASVIGLRATLFVGAIGIAFAAVPILLSPLRSLGPGQSPSPVSASASSAHA